VPERPSSGTLGIKYLVLQELMLSASSTIIEDILFTCKSRSALLAFFYCDFRNEKKKERRDILSSFIWQLCDQSDSYYDILSNFYSTHDRGSQQPSDIELTRCLQNVINCPKQVPIYIVVDALDECPNSYGLLSPLRKVLKLVEELVTLGLPKLHICVTSRPEKDIEAVLNCLKPHSVSLHDERGQKQDIQEYIRSVVNSNVGMMGRWRVEDKELVIRTLSEKARGM
jgi:hypothetical protein